MTLYYFKRHWDETTGDALTNSWGNSIYYFETNEEGEVFRQIEVYENGQTLRYDKNYVEDEFGGLSEVQLDLTEFEFEQFKIENAEFEQVWTKDKK
jgi:hypothetical protein